MNRKEFGELVATLRQDLGWTQFQLAEYSDLDEAVISQIERGVKKYFEPDLLFQLANTLQLTSLERHEFVLAAGFVFGIHGGGLFGNDLRARQAFRRVRGCEGAARREA